MCVFDLLEYWSLRISKNKTKQTTRFLKGDVSTCHNFILAFLSYNSCMTAGDMITTLYTVFLDPCQPLHTVIGSLGTFPGKHQISIWENKINGRRASPSLCLGDKLHNSSVYVYVLVGGSIGNMLEGQIYILQNS